MSHCLYSTVLSWGTGGGIAKLHGRLVHLSCAPDLHTGPVHAVDYVPEVGRARVAMVGMPERDMSQREISAADALLVAVCKG